MDLKIYNDPHVIPQLAAQWHALLAKFYHENIFYTPGYINAWYEAYGSHATQIICIYETPGNALLIAPLVTCADGWLRIAGYKRGDYNAIIFDKTEPTVFLYLIKWIITHKLKVEFSNEHELNRTHDLLPSPFRHNSNRWFKFLVSKYLGTVPFTTVKTSKDCPYIPNSNREDIISHITESRTHQQRIKIIKKLGLIQYGRTYEKPRIAELLPALFEMHIKQWDANNGKSLFLEQANKTFYHLLLQHVPPGRIRLDTLSLGQRILSMHLGFEDDLYVYYYKPCYDIAYRKHSPGAILLNHIIIQTMNSGKHFDFLKGMEAYKSDYTDAIQTVHQIKTQPSMLLRFLPNLYA
jgi:hypothetical protein